MSNVVYRSKFTSLCNFFIAQKNENHRGANPQLKYSVLKLLLSLNSNSFSFQCFGLLGINGAGKSTTLKCLTGELKPTRGHVLVQWVDIGDIMSLDTPAVGYCPQGHALDPLLTPRESLQFMAKIRGFPSNQIKQVGLCGDF